MTNPQGQTTTLDYNQQDQLKTITSHFGQQIKLTYKNNKLSQASSPTGTVNYHYQNNKLDKIIKVDGSTNQYHYNSNNQLESITDASSNTIARYQYDHQGRVIHTENAAGSQPRDINYSNAGTTVTDSHSNASDHYDFNVIHGILKNTSITDTDGNAETR